MSEKEKPVTDLTIYAPLELVNLNNLPSQSLDKLRDLKDQRALLRIDVVGSLVLATLCGSAGFLFFGLYILSLLSTPFVLWATFFAALFAVIFSVSFSIFWDKHARHVCEYRNLTVPPQLQLSAGTESRYIDMAKLINEMSVDLNIKMENEMRKDPSERNLKELRRKRTLLSENIEEIKAWANGGVQQPKTK